MKIFDLINPITFEYQWDVIENIPEFAQLKNCEQNPRWHSEGSAWNHTLAVCKATQDYVTKIHHISGQEH